MNSLKCIAQSTSFFEGEIFFTLRNANLIGKLDINANAFKYYLGPLEESPFVDSLYGGVFVLDNSIVVIPYNAEKLWMYDVTYDKWDSFVIPWEGIGNRNNQFGGGFVYCNKLFLLGDHAANIYVFDITNKKGIYILKEKTQLWCAGYSIIKNILYIGIAHTNSMLIVNLDNYSYKTIVIPQIGCIGGIQCINGSLWCVSQHGGNGGVVEISGDGEVMRSLTIDFSTHIAGALGIEDELILWGVSTDAYYINVLNGEKRREDERIFVAKKENERIAVATTYDGKIVLYYNGEKRDYDVEIEELFMDKYFDTFKVSDKKKQQIINEDGFMNLEFLIKVLTI